MEFQQKRCDPRVLLLKCSGKTCETIRCGKDQTLGHAEFLLVQEIDTHGNRPAPLGKHNYNTVGLGTNPMQAPRLRKLREMCGLRKLSRQHEIILEVLSSDVCQTGTRVLLG